MSPLVGWLLITSQVESTHLITQHVASIGQVPVVHPCVEPIDRRLTDVGGIPYVYVTHINVYKKGMGQTGTGQCGNAIDGGIDVVDNPPIATGIDR